MNCFSGAFRDFGLTISPKKRNILVHDVYMPLSIITGDYELQVVKLFTYLGSTISRYLTLYTEIGKKIRKAATTFARLIMRAWENSKFSFKTKMVV